MNGRKRNTRNKALWKAALLSGVVLSVLFIPLVSMARGGVAREDLATAEAFPGDTLFYVELIRPVESLDRLSRMTLWPEVRSLLAEVARLHEGEAPAAFLADGLAAWDRGCELRNHLDVIAGRSLALGLIPVPGAQESAAVFVLRGDPSGDPVASLAWLIARCRTGCVLSTGADRSRGSFRILDIRGRVLLVGQETGGGLVLSPPSGAAQANAVAAALSPSGAAQPAPLSANAEFVRTMSGFPAAPGARVYMDTPRLLDLVLSCDELPAQGKRLAEACLGFTGPMGLSREVAPDCIRTRVAGRVLADEMDAAFPGLLDSLIPIERPISAWFPRSALMTYEAGAPLEKVLDVMKYYLGAWSPWLDDKAASRFASFKASTGLDPAVDLYPLLNGPPAVAWLPADEIGWPLPRIMVMVRVADAEGVERFLSGLLEWKAGAMAPITGGLAGAFVVSEVHEEVDVKGLQLDCIIPLPLPSPAYALAGGFLIASPHRSAVKEAVSAVHGSAPRLSEEEGFPSGPARRGTVELLHVNFHSWEGEWRKFREIGVSLCSLLMEECDCLSDLELSRKELDGLGEAVFNLLGTLDRATGATVLASDGRFEFSMEVRAR